MSSVHNNLFVIVLLLPIPWWKNTFSQGVINTSESLASEVFEDTSLTFIIEDEKQEGARVVLMVTDNFKTLRLQGSVFVDKSEMLNEYLERGGLVLTVTRPRKWGKSVNIDMFKRFFEIEVDQKGVPLPEESQENSVLFTGGNAMLGNGKVKKIESLKIAQFVSAMDYHGKNPVILLSLKNVNGRTYQEFRNAIADRIHNLFLTFPYLSPYAGNTSHLFLKSHPDKLERSSFNEINLENSLYFLSKLLFRHFKRHVYIFIDDYDTPIANAYLQFGVKAEEFRKVVDLTYQIIEKALKDNYYLERGLLTGTYHFGWINEIIKLHNVRHSTIVCMTFSKYYGFTQYEIDNIVKQLYTKFDMGKIKDWYNGYNFDGIMVYNPWSTLSCLAEGGKFGHYWGNILNTTDSLIDHVLLSDNVQEYLNQLLQGKIITRKDINKPINLVKIDEMFHRVLLYEGYLNSVPAFCESNCYIHPWNLSLPNKEVRDILAKGVSKWVAYKLNVSVSEYFNLTYLLVNLQIDYFGEMFQKYLLNSLIPKAASEQQHAYHQLVGGIFSSLAGKYMVDSRRKPGQRSREYILIALPESGNDAIIVEYEVTKAPKKLVSTVEAGLKRLLSRSYDMKTVENKNIRQIIKIYMGFCRKKVALKYQVSEVG